MSPRLHEVLGGPDPGPYSAKTGATVTTYDGLCYRSVIYKDGKRIGETFQDGNGGSLMIEMDAGALAEVEAYARTLPDSQLGNEFDAELFLDEIAETELARKKLARSLKKKAFYWIDGRLASVALRVGETVEALTASLQKKHPTALLVNDLIAGVQS